MRANRGQFRVHIVSACHLRQHWPKAPGSSSSIRRFSALSTAVAVQNQTGP